MLPIQRPGVSPSANYIPENIVPGTAIAGCEEMQPAGQSQALATEGKKILVDRDAMWQTISCTPKHITGSQAIILRLMVVLLVIPIHFGTPSPWEIAMIWLQLLGHIAPLSQKLLQPGNNFQRMPQALSAITPGCLLAASLGRLKSTNASRLSIRGLSAMVLPAAG